MSSINVYNTGFVNITGSGTANVFPEPSYYLYVWGNAANGGTAPSTDVSDGITDIKGSSTSFCMLKPDGSVTVWGAANKGGDYTDNTYTGQGDLTSVLSSGGVSIFAGGYSFAVLKSDGSVYSWGDQLRGGNSTAPKPIGSSLASGVVEIYTTGNAYAAIKSDGSVVTWGHRNYAGDYTLSGNYDTTKYPTGLETVLGPGAGVTKMFTNTISKWDNKALTNTGNTFAALKGGTGELIIWGHKTYGADETVVTGGVLTSGVTDVIINNRAGAALKTDGSVVTWGSATFGGDMVIHGGDNDGTNVSSSLNGTIPVVKLFNTSNSFAALRNDSSVIVWGGFSAGGDPLDSIYGIVANGGSGNVNSGVVDIKSDNNSFAALKDDGTVVTWGYNLTGGANSSSPYGGTLTNVDKIINFSNSYAAIKNDGSVVTWGSNLQIDFTTNYNSTQYPTGVASLLSSGVIDIISTQLAYAAIKNDGTIVTWGYDLQGADSSSVDFTGFQELYTNGEAFSAVTYK